MSLCRGGHHKESLLGQGPPDVLVTPVGAAGLARLKWRIASTLRLGYRFLLDRLLEGILASSQVMGTLRLLLLLNFDEFTGWNQFFLQLFNCWPLSLEPTCAQLLLVRRSEKLLLLFDRL